VTTPTFGAALGYWLKLEFINHRGPAGRIAMMSRELLELRKWVDERTFVAGLNFTNRLPGPEATQVAIYIGLGQHGLEGVLPASRSSCGW
jgi:chromate transporter